MKSRILNGLKRNFFDIFWWRDNLLYTFLKLFDKKGGIGIMEEEWDNIIILDCCRYDAFKKIYDERGMKGELEIKESRGTWTVEFLRENFPDRYDDIVYITANPYVDKYLKGKFYRIVSVWRYGWSERYNTVLPSEMYRYTLKALKKYKNKRIITHFIQPHHPYLSLKCDDMLLDKIRRSVLYDENSKRRCKSSLTKIYSVDIYASYDPNTLMRAYLDNLRIVMPYVESLLNVLPGTTVVTSDHGESFGDKIHSLIPIKFYGHGFTRMKCLIEVPWLTVGENLKDPYKDPKELRKEIRLIESKFLSEKLKIRYILRRRLGCFSPYSK